MSTWDHDTDQVTISLAAADGIDGESGALTDDRVLALRSVASPVIHRLPNQHDLMNIDDDEVFTHPIMVTLGQDEVLEAMHGT
ncbi:MAG: hypothetical protein M3121_04335 [Chloroflexota bacterium]|nr:hypothetical protein [Chloroflexota bacterium]